MLTSFKQVAYVCFALWPHLWHFGVKNIQWFEGAIFSVLNWIEHCHLSMTNDIVCYNEQIKPSMKSFVYLSFATAHCHFSMFVSWIKLKLKGSKSNINMNSAPITDCIALNHWITIECYLVCHQPFSVFIFLHYHNTLDLHLYPPPTLPMFTI